MMPVKADLAICSSAIGVSGMLAFMSSHYLDFSSCGIVPQIRSHINLTRAI